MRGIIPATILAFIEQRTGKPIYKLFDLIAGTSTGGILALGLTRPDSNGQAECSAQRLCEIYDQYIPQIFKNPQSWLGNLLRPKYTSFAFQDILKEFFADYRLKDALIDVIVPCYDIEHRLPYVFRSRMAKLQAQDDFYMRDAVLAASASPTLFHPVRIPRKYKEGRYICLVDGGVFANNPSIYGYSEIKSLSNDESDEVLLVSIGTGRSNRSLSDEFISLWGYVQWSRPMLELVMESISESIHEQIRPLLSKGSQRQYYRIQVELPESTNFAIDDASSKNMSILSQTADAFCPTSQDLAELCDRLLSLSETEAAIL